mgnify:CR=1 FL=1
MKKTLILILCLFLCTVSFARKRVKVACVGNSITYGIGVSDPDKESYPARLQQMLGEGYTVELLCNRKSLRMHWLLLVM